MNNRALLHQTSSAIKPRHTTTARESWWFSSSQTKRAGSPRRRWGRRASPRWRWKPAIGELLGRDEHRCRRHRRLRGSAIKGRIRGETGEGLDKRSALHGGLA